MVEVRGQLQGVVDKLKAKELTSRLEQEELARQVTALESLVKVRDLELMRVEQEVVAGLRDELTAAKSTVADLGRRQGEMDIRAKGREEQLRATISTLEREVSKLSGELRARTGELEDERVRLEDQVKELRACHSAAVSALEAEYGRRLLKQRQQYEAELGEVRQVEARAREDLDILVESYTWHEEEVARLRGELERVVGEARREVLELRSGEQVLQDKLREAGQALETLRVQQADRVKVLEGELSRALARASDVDVKRQAMADSLTQCRHQLELSEGRLQELQRDNTQLRQDMLKVKELAESTRRGTDVAVEVAVNNAMAKFTGKLEEMAQLVQAHERATEEARAQTAAAEAEAQDLRAMLENTDHTISQLQGEREQRDLRWQAALERVQASERDFRARLEQCEVRLAEAREQHQQEVAVLKGNFSQVQLQLTSERDTVLSELQRLESTQQTLDRETANVLEGLIMEKDRAVQELARAQAEAQHLAQKLQQEQNFRLQFSTLLQRGTLM